MASEDKKQSAIVVGISPLTKLQHQAFVAYISQQAPELAELQLQPDLLKQDTPLQSSRRTDSPVDDAA